MRLEIITTTDGRYIGRQFNSDDRPIYVDVDRPFIPDRMWQISPPPAHPSVWRLANSNYVIDAKEV